MLFNLSKQRCFRSVTDKAIQGHSKIGPAFTGGHSYELCARYEPFDGDNNCVSRSDGWGFKIPVKDGKNMLTNKERWDGKFTITELEVWQVEFID